MLNGLFWSAIEKYSSLVLSIIISVILARLLSPNDYGTVAIATVIISFISMVSSIGIGPAVIQNNNLDKEDLNSLYSITVYISLFATLLFFLLSGIISSIYNEPILKNVCKLLSIQVFFNIINMVPNALMFKQKRFREVAKRTLLLQVICGTLSIYAAYKGLGIYSLIISPIITSIGIYIYNKYFQKVHFKFKVSTNVLNKIFSFSIYSFLFDFVNYFSRNLDKLIIGKYIGMSQLGFYEKSYHLMQQPLNNLTSVINPVLQPILSVLQDDKKEIARNYNKIISFISTISFPLGVTLFFTAEDIIVLMYGEKWIGAVDTFKILSLSIPLQLILSTTGGIFLSANASKNLFYVGLRNTCFTVTGFLIAAYRFKTIESIATAWTVTSFICFASSYYELYKVVLKSSLRTMLSKLLFPFGNVVVLSIVLVSFGYCCNQNLLIVSLITKLSISTITTILYLVITKQYTIILQYLKQ